MDKIIDDSIRNHWSIVIEYKNTNGQLSIHFLSGIKYHQGKDYICAFSMEFRKELIFKVDRIISINSKQRVNDILKEAIQKNDIIQIVYKNEDKLLLFLIDDYECDVNYDKMTKFNAFCREERQYRTFLLDNIMDAKLIWRDITNKDVIITEEGTYVIACMYDNYYQYEVYKFHKNERLWNLFESVDKHFPVAYSLLPVYNSSNYKWESKCDQLTDKDGHKMGIILCAFLTDSGIEYGLDEPTGSFHAYTNPSLKHLSDLKVLGKFFIPRYD